MQYDHYPLVAIMLDEHTLLTIHWFKPHTSHVVSLLTHGAHVAWQPDMSLVVGCQEIAF